MKFYDPCAYACACSYDASENQTSFLLSARRRRLWPQSRKEKSCGPNQFRDSYVSLLNNIADFIRSTVVSCLKQVRPK